jgi:NAD-dependent deacetylase
MKDLISRAAWEIYGAEHLVVLTGAGISTESGIPDFRSPGGLWEKYDPTEFMYERFMADPKRIWEMSLTMKEEGDLDMEEAEPNPAHTAIAELEAMGYLKCVITQNVDNLHQKAGSKDVIEFHGNLLFGRCISCSQRYPIKAIEAQIERAGLPPRCEKCEGILKPDAVFFGEPIPPHALHRSISEARMADVMIVAGTSAVVYPAAELPFIAKRGGGFFSTSVTEPSQNAGAVVIEINNEPTALTGRVSDYIILGMVGTILPRIVQEVKELEKQKGKSAERGQADRPPKPTRQ